MTEKIVSASNDDRMDRLIDSLLSRDTPEELIFEGLDQETEELLTTARQVISLSENYPGAPELSPQDRIHLLTTYRSEFQQAAEPSKENLFSSFQPSQFRWAAAGLMVLVIFIVFRFAGNVTTELQASSGLLSSLLPVIVLAVASIIAVFLLLRRK